MAALFVVLITLMSTNIFGQTTDLVKFTFNGLPGGANLFGASPFTPATTATNLTVVGLTRGSGLGTAGTAGQNAWGGSAANLASTQVAATTSNNVVTFSLTANAGYKLSLTQIPAYNIRRSSTGFTTGIWQYSINGGTFTDIGSSITWGATTTSSGNAQSAITFTNISALQNVAAGNIITLRVVLWGASGTGTWYFNQPTAGVNDLIVKGTVDIASVAPTPTCVANITASGPTTFCQGANVTLTANSGSSYLWSNGATTQSISATTAGSYTVRVIDAAGTCTNTSSATEVTVNALPTASFSANGSTTFCQGDNVTLTANTGSSYLWSNGATTQSISATTAGTYSVIVTNANGCSANSSLQSIVVNSLPAASVSANGSTSLCNGGNVILTANSANSYLWSNGATDQSISVNTAGSYSVQVTDANGCSNNSAAQDVVVYSSPNLNISATNTLLCLGQSVTLNANILAKDLIISEYVEGSSNNKYLEIYNGTGASVNLSDYRYQAFHNGATSPSFNVQLTGTLLNGASIVYSNSGAAIYSGQNTSLGISLSYNGNDAFGLYKISTSSFVDIFGVIGQDPGTAWTNGIYTTKDKTLRRKLTVHSGVTVNPSNGFSTLAAEWDIYNTDDVSGLSSHSINDVNYTWSNNSTNNSITETPTVNSVYSIIGTDLNGCTSTSSITINVTNIAASSSASSILCNGGTAVVSVSANGGTGVYAGTGDNNVSAGSYNYAVTDANGCSANTTIVVSEPTAININVTATNLTCNAVNSTVTISASNGTAPYIGTGTFVRPAGTYSYTITDANGCSVTQSYTINQPDVITLSSSSPTIACHGGNTTLTLTANAGNGPYTYIMNGNQNDDDDDDDDDHDGNHNDDEDDDDDDDHDGNTTILSNNSGLFNVTAGTYQFTVIDANGCSATITITVTAPPALLTSVSKSTILCNGGTSNVVVTASGGTPPYNGTGTFIRTAGNYNFTVTDANGCSVVKSITITQPSALVVNAGVDQIVYTGYQNCKTLKATKTGGTGSVNYVWSNGVTNANNTVCPTNAASYTVTATDSKGCVATDVVNVCAVNVVCSAGNSNVQKVEICHQGNTLCVSVNAVAAHLAHGCSLGSCAEANACNNLSSRMVINESTSDETVMSEIKLFPNPAKDNLMITLSNIEEMGSVSYSIINAIGQEVYTGTLNSTETTINISTLNSGMYYFKTITQTTKPIIFIVQ